MEIVLTTERLKEIIRDEVLPAYQIALFKKEVHIELGICDFSKKKLKKDIHYVISPIVYPRIYLAPVGTDKEKSIIPRIKWMIDFLNHY